MFTKFKKSPDALDKEIERLLTAMKSTELAAEKYDKLLERYTKLHKIKTDQESSGVSKDTALMAATNLTGILLIINHERIHVIATKALGFAKFK